MLKKMQFIVLLPVINLGVANAQNVNQETQKLFYSKEYISTMKNELKECKKLFSPSEIESCERHVREKLFSHIVKARDELRNEVNSNNKSSKSIKDMMELYNESKDKPLKW